MYQLTIAVLLIIYGVIVYRNFRLAVFLFLAVLPAYLLRLNIFGFPTTMLELMLGIITIGWLIKLTEKKIDLSFAKPWLIPFIILLIAGIIGVVIAPDKMAALGIFKAYLVEPIIFFFILYTTLKNFGDPETALMFLGLGALPIALFVVYQHFTGQAIPLPWDLERRATGFFPYPNAVGLYLGPIIVLGLGALWRSLRVQLYPQALFWLLTIGLSGAAIVFSQTEAAWVAIPIALLLSGLLFTNRKLLTLAILIPAIILIILTPAIQSKILLQDYSGSVRLKQWEESFNMLKENWLFGAGLAGYPAALEPYHTHQEIEIFQYPHNIILNIWTELGILGLIAAVWLAGLSLKNFRQAKKKSSSFNWLAFAAVTALLEMSIHGLVDAPFFKNDLAMLTSVVFVFLAWSATEPYADKINLEEK